MRISVLLLCFGLSPWVFPVAPAGADDRLTLKQAFGSGPKFGSRATSYGFSGDGKWACWLHRGWQARRHGRDLFVLRLDVVGAEPQRLTSAAALAPQVPAARRALTDWRARNRAAAGERQLTEAEAGRLPADDLRADGPVYPGVRLAAWSPVGAGLLFVVGDDLFRWRPGDKAPLRLASDGARELWWQADGLGVIYRVRRTLVRLRWRGADPLDQSQIQRTELGLAVPFVSASGVVPSPDGNWVAIVRRVGASSTRSRAAVLGLSGRWPTVQPHNRRMPGDEARGATEFALYRVADGQTQTLWSQPYGGVYDRLYPAWRRDSRQLAALGFTQATSPQGRIELIVTTIDAAADGPRAAKPRRLLGYDHQGSPYLQNLLRPRWAGDRIVLLDERTGWRRLISVDPVTAKTRPLTPVGGEVYCFAAEAGAAYVQSTHGRSDALSLARVDLAQGEMQTVTPPIAAFVEPVASAGGRWFLARRQRYGWLEELVLVDGASGRTRQLTRSHPPSARALVDRPPRVIALKNRRGGRIPATLFTPAGWKASDRRRAVVVVYGGPLGAQKMIQQGNVGPLEYLMPRVLADAFGWVCLAVDVRGSSGYGVAWSRAPYGRPGVPQVEDLVDVAAGLGAYGVDPRRVGLFGWSYGAHVVCRALLTEPKRFAGGVACAPVVDWRNYYAEYVQAAVGPADGLAALGLVPLASKLKRPLLLVHGVRDRVVLFADTLALYRALLQAERGHRVELFFDPTGGHRLGGQVSMQQLVRKVGTFFAQVHR